MREKGTEDFRRMVAEHERKLREAERTTLRLWNDLFDAMPRRELYSYRTDSTLSREFRILVNAELVRRTLAGDFA